MRLVKLSSQTIVDLDTVTTYRFNEKEEVLRVSPTGNSSTSAWRDSEALGLWKYLNSSCETHMYVEDGVFEMIDRLYGATILLDEGFAIKRKTLVYDDFEETCVNRGERNTLTIWMKKPTERMEELISAFTIGSILRLYKELET